MSIPPTWTHPRQARPWLPTRDGVWGERATEVIRAATRLEGALPATTRAALVPLLRLMNCYYSNLIEGHRTLPAEVAAAWSAGRTAGKAQQVLVAEALAHLQVQADLDARARHPDFVPTRSEALAWMHAAFIDRLPEDLRWSEPRPDGSRLPIRPGAWREDYVTVGAHIPPAPVDLPAFLAAFGEAYGDPRQASPAALAVLAAAHQRLLWIHPFLDGNGRVARLMSDAMIARLGLDAGGLWRLARGFARRNAEYKALLAEADRERQGDLDGRENLSQRAMDAWCAFVLAVAHDQIRFMTALLAVDALPQRIIAWAQTAFPRSSALRIGLLLERLLRYGGVSREIAVGLLAVSDRHARRLIDRLAHDGLLRCAADGTLEPAIPIHVVPAWFPDLFPRNEDAGMAAAMPQPF